MVESMRRWSRGALMLLLAGGCGKDGDEGMTAGAEGDPVLRQNCLEYIPKERTWACWCAPDFDACAHEFSVPEEDEECLCEAYAHYPENADFFACANPAADDYVACLDTLSCDLPEGKMMCSDMFAAHGCVGSRAGQAEADALCHGRTNVFKCASGRYVYSDQVCNGMSECDDGSDEANC